MDKLTKTMKWSVWCIVFFILITITFYFCKFHDGLSNNNSDWGYFGEYLGGLINPILTALNIYVFYRLTRTISDFDKQNIKKQLTHSTYKEYQSKINDLTFKFLDSIQQLGEIRKYKKDGVTDITLEPKYNDLANNMLHRIKYFVDSFVTEVSIDEEDVNETKKELEKSIDKLINSDFSEGKLIQDFFEKKSQFIKEIFKLIIVYDSSWK